MKNTMISLIRSVTVVIMVVAFISATPVTKTTPPQALNGYVIEAKCGSPNEVYQNCGEDILVTVANSSTIIETGTEVWCGHTMVIPYPDGVITSKTGATNGQSFYVVNGIVGTSATPCF